MGFDKSLEDLCQPSLVPSNSSESWQQIKDTFKMRDQHRQVIRGMDPIQIRLLNLIFQMKFSPTLRPNKFFQGFKLVTGVASVYNQLSFFQNLFSWLVVYCRFLLSFNIFNIFDQRFIDCLLMVLKRFHFSIFLIKNYRI